MNQPNETPTLDGTVVRNLAQALNECDSVVVGAGAGLSTAAGLAYSGERFQRYFADFAEKCGFRDMYSGGFCPYETLEEHWAYWSRQIWVNRYAPVPKDTYGKLLRLLAGKDHFVLTTNVDHCFQRSGFDKKRLFYTQGDYGFFQCPRPCCNETWDNYDAVRAMVESQGYVVENDGSLTLPEGVVPAMEVPSELVPVCPHCGRPAVMNLRVDGTFVEDAGWREASARYADFLEAHADADRRVLFLELGVGGNTPVIIKYPFWRMTSRNPQATYACVNLGEAYAPSEIESRSICIDGDIDQVLEALVEAEADAASAAKQDEEA